jgi:hypothetical protein
MKLKAIALALFVAGAGSSYALAGDGHGNGKGDDSTTTAVTQTAGTHGDKKVTVCHKAGKSGRWVRITVSKHALKAKLKHGDVAPDASGHCPAAAEATTGETTTASG